ncbi:MAG: hypothetical protein ABI479_06800 [Gallionella sp.]
MSLNFTKLMRLVTHIMLPCLSACSLGQDDADYTSFAVPSPSGASSIARHVHGLEQLTYNLQLNTSHGGDSTSTQNLLPHDVDLTGSDAAIFAWDGDNHLTVGWPDGFKPIHGLKRVGDIDISYRSYEPDIDRISSHNLHNLRLHNTTVSFKELDLQDDNARYVATNEPVPNIKCIVEISGLDGEAYEGVSVQIIGNGIGRAGDKYPSLGMVSVDFIFKKAVSQYASLTPTQAKLSSIYPHFPYDSHPPATTVIPTQTKQSLSYPSFGLSDALNIFDLLQKGKLEMKVGLNFGQEILYYEADVNLSRDIIDKFNACSAKTNIYYSPSDIYSTLFQIPYSPKDVTGEATSSLNKATDVIPAFHVGESFDDFMADIKKRGYKNSIIDTHSRSANGEVTRVSLGSSGISLFFANVGNHELETIRYDQPYSGKVRGIGLGDRLDYLNNVLGSPVKAPSKFADKSVYIYTGVSNRYDRFDIGDDVVKTIFVIR